MNLNGVVIRSKEQMTTMQKELRDALLQIVKQDNLSVPVVYQYLHKPGVEISATTENTMGMMRNIRMKDDAIVGDIEIYNILKIASNFTGVIDNLAVSASMRNTKSTKPAYKLEALIVYDKVAKERILQKRKNMEERLAMPGNVPLISGEEKGVAIQNATKEILADFERRFAKEQPNKSNEGGNVDESE